MIVWLYVVTTCYGNYVYLDASTYMYAPLDNYNVPIPTSIYLLAYMQYLLVRCALYTYIIPI